MPQPLRAHDFPTLSGDGLQAGAWSVSDECERLYSHLTVLADPAASGERYSHLLDLFYGQLLTLTAQLKRGLRDTPFPLAPALKQNIGHCVELHAAMAAGYRHLLSQDQAHPRPLMGRMMRSLAEQLALTSLSAASAPAGLWYGAYQLFLEARNQDTPEASLVATDAERIFREMLSLAACTPEGLCGREYLLVEEYAALFAASVQITDEPPEQGAALGGWFWMDMGADQAPLALSRRGPSAAFDQVMYFSCTALAELADSQARGLEQGGKLLELRLPITARDEPAYLVLLRRLSLCWRDVPKRQHARQAAQQAVVQVCAGFENFWRLLEQQDQGMPALDMGMVNEWTVLNTSAVGYGLLQRDGVLGQLQNGGVVAVRSGHAQAWDVCVIRRLSHREQDQGLEIGLQIVARGAQPVKVGFLGGHDNQVRLALQFDPAPPARPRAAMLAPVGTAYGQRLVWVSGAKRIYVAQGRFMAMEWQTAQVEFFVYEMEQRPQ